MDPEKRLKCFLHTGSDKQDSALIYDANRNVELSVSTKPLGHFESLNLILTQMISMEQGTRFVQIIKDVFNNGTYKMKDLLLYSLAKAMSVKEPATVSKDARLAALEILDQSKPDEMIRLFCYYAKCCRSNNSSGIGGKGIRKLANKWFIKQDPQELLFLQGCSFKFRDFIKLTHLKPETEEQKVLLSYYLFGLEKTRDKFSNTNDPGAKALMIYIEKLNALKTSRDVDEVAKLVKSYYFDTSHIWTPHMSSDKVWIACLPRMNLRSILCNFKFFHKRGFLCDKSHTVFKVIMKELSNEMSIKPSKLQPADILIIYTNCIQLWKRPTPKDKREFVDFKNKVNKEMLQALFSLSTLTYRNLPPLDNKKILICVDNRISMDKFCWYSNNVTCFEAAGTTVLSLANAQGSDVTLCTFAQEKNKVNMIQFDKTDSIKDVRTNLIQGGLGKIDFLRPLQHVIKNNCQFDAVVCLTSIHTHSEKENFKRTLALMRDVKGNGKTRFIVGAFGTPQFDLGQADDPLTLEVRGFDGNVPHVIAQFINEAF